MTSRQHTSHSYSLTLEPFAYGRALVVLHWLMALLLVAVYASIELRVFFPKGTEMRDLMKATHFMLGLGVLVMLVLRIAARVSSPAPVHKATARRDWMALLVAGGHLALYALMLGMPLLGWLVLSAKGKPVPFFGFELPGLIAPDKGLAKSLEDLHVTLGTAGYFLIGTHVTAALAHHYVLKDGLLNRMTLVR